MKPIITSLRFIATLIFGTPSLLRADNDSAWADVTTAGNWLDSTKWAGGLPAYGPGKTASFETNINATTTVTQDAEGLVIGNLTFSDNGDTGSAWVLAGPYPIELANATSAAITTLTPSSISAQLTGGTGLSKEGNATLILSSLNNTYTGGTTVNSGTLQATLGTPATGTLTPFGTGLITVNTGTNLNLMAGGTGNSYTFPNALNLNGANLYHEDAHQTIAGNVALTGANTITGRWGGKELNLPGVISGTGSIERISSPGQYCQLNITGASNTYSGGTIVTSGEIISNPGIPAPGLLSPFGSGPINVRTGAGVRFKVGSTANAYSYANAINLNGGTLYYEDGLQTISGSVTLTGANTIQGQWGGKTLTLSGVVSGSGSLQKATSGSVQDTLLFLTGANTYTGATSIVGGGINVSSLNSVSGGSATSSLGAPTTIANGTISIGSSTSLTVPTSLVYSGTGETTDRVVNLNGFSNFATLFQSGTGTLKFTSNLTATGIASKTLTLNGSTAGTGEIAGAIVDNGTVGITSLGATFAVGATTVTLASVDGIAVGAAIAGPGITGGQTITAINPSTKVVTLSAGTNAASGTIGTLYTVTGVKNLTGVSKAGTGTWTLSGTNTYTGTTNVTGGVLKLAKQASLYNAVSAAWNAANLTVGSGATAALNVGGAGEFTSADITTLQALTNVVTGTPATLGFKSGGIIGLDTTNAPGGSFTFDGVLANHVATNGTITTTDTLGLRKLGTGKLVLTGFNANTGGTTVDSGTLDLAVGGGTGAIRGNLTVANGATVKVSVANGMGNTQNLRVGNIALSGTIDLQNTGTNSLTAATLTLNGGTLTGMAGSKFDLRDNNSGNTNVASTASATTSVISVPTLGTPGNNPTFTVAAGTTASGIDLLVTSNIVNDAGTGGNGGGVHNLIKAGAGHLRLSGANTYSGTTTVNAGTLSGTGSPFSALSVAATGTLAPGAGLGTWSATTATFVAGATFLAEINSTTATADKLATTGAVDLGGATLSLADLGAATLASGTKLTLVDYTGGSLTGTFAGLAEGATVAVGSNTFTLSYADASKVTLSIAGSGYSTWATANAGGQAANLDFDGDGVPNGVEYFMGQTGSSFTANPKPVNGLITWPKDPAATATFVVQVSTDLTNWIPAPSGVTNNATTVTYQLPVGPTKTFARLKVTTP